MPFEQGHKKIGGRKEGTPNRNTRKLRILLRGVLELELTELKEYLSKIENPKDKIEIIIKLMPYVFPKVTSESLFELGDSSDGESSFILD